MTVSNADFMELSARCEALARLNLHLVAVLDDQHVIDGQQFRTVLTNGMPHGSRHLERTAALMQEMLAAYSQATATVRRQRIWSANRSGLAENGPAR